MSRRGTPLGSMGLVVRPTTTVNIHVPLTKTARRLLRKRGRLRVTAAVSAHDHGGSHANTSAPVLLRAVGR